MKFTIETIGKELELIKAQGKKLDNRLQTAGLSVIELSHEHRNSELLTKLIDCMPKGGRKSAMKKWLETFGVYAWVSVDDDNEAETRGVWKRVKDTPDLEGAESSPWFTFKPESVYRVFDLQQEIEKLLARAKKAVDQTNAEGDKQRYHKVTSKQLLALCNKLDIDIDSIESK